MATLWAVLFIALLFPVLFTHVLSLPANWFLLLLILAWKLLHPASMTWGFMGLLLALAAIGEALEFAAQYYGGKRYGASARGNLGGIIGAILGAIACAPFLLGLGAVPGALGGAFLGCYVFEKFEGHEHAHAWRAAWGAFWGKMFGMTAKFSLGAAMVAMSIPRIWP